MEISIEVNKEHVKIGAVAVLKRSCLTDDEVAPAVRIEIAVDCNNCVIAQRHFIHACVIRFIYIAAQRGAELAGMRDFYVCVVISAVTDLFMSDFYRDRAVFISVFGIVLRFGNRTD